MPKNNFGITVNWKGKDVLNSYIHILERNQYVFEIQEKIAELGPDIAQHMIKFIDSNRKRYRVLSESGLTSSINSRLISEPAYVEVDVGLISELNQNAPYWEMINDGATYETKTQHVVPFHEHGGFRTYIEGSRHVIPPMHYIEDSVEYSNMRINQIVKELGQIFLEQYVQKIKTT